MLVEESKKMPTKTNQKPKKKLQARARTGIGHREKQSRTIDASDCA